MNKLSKLEIYTDIHYKCGEQNDVMAVSGSKNCQPIEGWIQSCNENPG